MFPQTKFMKCAFLHNCNLHYSNQSISLQQIFTLFDYKYAAFISLGKIIQIAKIPIALSTQEENITFNKWLSLQLGKFISFINILLKCFMIIFIQIVPYIFQEFFNEVMFKYTLTIPIEDNVQLKIAKIYR